MKKLLLTIGILFTLIFGYAGGYWENLPLLNRISGPKRFRQFVSAPIPNYIQNIYGGYSGFPQGIIKTYFTFNSPPSEWEFIKEWTLLNDDDCLKYVLGYLPEFRASSVYVKYESSGTTKKDCDNDMYLLIDSMESRGVLFIP